MKKKTLVTLLALSGLVNFGSAATITALNYVEPLYNSINTAANVETSGIFTLGYYASAPTSAANFLNGYSELGSLKFGTTYGGTNGYLSGDINIALAGGALGIGKEVYAVVGNGSTLANSTEVLVWKPTSNPAGNIFTEDAPSGGPNEVQFFNKFGKLLVGTFNSDNSSFRMASVPEVSSFLLSLVGSLSVLRRRRC